MSASPRGSAQPGGSAEPAAPKVSRSDWRAPSRARVAGLSEREVVSALGLLELAGRVGREGESWRRARASDRRASDRRASNLDA